MKLKQTTAVVASTFLLAGGGTSAAYAASYDSYLGTIFLTAASYCPDNSVPAYPGLHTIEDNTALYTLVGTIYGGNGVSTYGLPDLTVRSIVGVGTGPGLSPVARGQQDGAQSTTLSLANLPAHEHQAELASPQPNTTFAVSTQQGTNPTPEPGDWVAMKRQGFAAQRSYIPAADKGTTATLATSSGEAPARGHVALQNKGSGSSMNISPPTLVLRYCIVTNGFYPPRS